MWSLGLVAFFGIWYLVETYGLALDWSYHLVHGVALVPMVIIGVPHVLIAYLFLATSRKMQSWRSFALLGGLTLLGIGLCWLYFSAGATAAASKIPVALVNFYFIVHHLRDEAFFYQVSGDAPANADRERIRRFLDAATWLFILVLLGVAAYFYDQHAHHQVPPRHGLLDYMFPPDLAYVWRALALALPMLLLVLWQLARWAKAEPGGVLVTLRRHR